MPWVRWVALLPLAGCSSILGLGDPEPLPPDAPPASCMVAGFDLCAHQQPNGPIHFGSDVAINTELECNVVLFTPEGGSVCVIYATDMTIDATLHATGVRPLVLAATGTITVNGSVDVSSAVNGSTGAGSNPNGCAVRVESSGYGGAAGGSFHGKGGNGGTGMGGSSTAGQSADAVPMPTFLRGGCDGGRAGQLGGPAIGGGGAVQLAAAGSIDITSTGRVLAGGGGGFGGAGAGGGGSGGGGSGGMIALGAPTIHIAGIVAANGGGGAEGSDMAGSGKSGADGTANAIPAAGGSGSSAGGGDGGNGAAGTTLAGSNAANGTASPSSGGGGGGGAGFIVIDSPAIDTTGATISPPQS